MLNRPERRNALSWDLVEALLFEIEVARSDGTRLLVLRGEGKTFCSGFDLQDCAGESDGDITLRFIRIEQLRQALRHAPFDTLALAQGFAFGAGADLFAACARRLCAPSTEFLMPGLRFGIVLGTRQLAQRVGAQRARELLSSGRRFSADEAVDWGFATGKMTVDEWDACIDEAQGFAERLSPQACRQLFSATTEDERDRELAELVRSAAEPGLKARIEGYVRDRGITEIQIGRPAQASGARRKQVDQNSVSTSAASR